MQLTWAAPEIAATDARSVPADFNLPINISRAFTHIIVGAVIVTPSSCTFTPP